VLLAGCGGTSAGSDDGGKLTLVAYSTPREVYQQLTDDFAKQPEGQGVTFQESYGSSGEQSRAVESGLPADVVAFSLAPDITRLVEAGMVEEDWADDEYGGMVTSSVVVFAVRKGNPKAIRTWDDLVKDGVEVIEPNPFTSGGARWNVMAAYGAQRKLGKSHDQAVAYLQELFKHVSVQDKSARESLQTFTGGKGDVLLAYENEAILAEEKGEELDYIVPEQTILIENPVAVVSESKNVDKARAFVDFIRSPEAQRVFGKAGYRPVEESLAGEFQFPKPKTLFTIQDVGGWEEVQERFFDREDGIMAAIQRDVGAALE
jgi:sulfate/thiosulfate transport system substrate-binding protein